MITPSAPAVMKTDQTAKDLEEAIPKNELEFLDFP
jgi:hypothetical protein